jgi:hypothetical protein
MVQGNKRTPDKFVGKEAVITSQCLNGWLVVIDLFFGFRIVWVRSFAAKGSVQVPCEGS